MILTVALCFAQPVPADAPPVTAEMHQRFQTVMRIREHVIQGKLDEAKKLGL